METTSFAFGAIQTMAMADSRLVTFSPETWQKFSIDEQCHIANSLAAQLDIFPYLIFRIEFGSDEGSWGLPEPVKNGIIQNTLRSCGEDFTESGIRNLIRQAETTFADARRMLLIHSITIKLIGFR